MKPLRTVIYVRVDLELNEAEADSFYGAIVAGDTELTAAMRLARSKLEQDGAIVKSAIPIPQHRIEAVA